LEQDAGFGLQGGHELDEPNYRFVLCPLFSVQFPIIALLTEPLNALLEVGARSELNDAPGDFRRQTLAQRIDQFINQGGRRFSHIVGKLWRLKASVNLP
jgi:hypothetical protein